MREGMYEAIPESSLSRQTAEDLRLLLCGCPHIDVDVVRGITIFDDESRKCLSHHSCPGVNSTSVRVCVCLQAKIKNS